MCLPGSGTVSILPIILTLPKRGRPNPTLLKLVSQLFDSAEKGGFLAYSWTNRASGDVEPKVSYSVIIPGRDWLIGADVHTTDIQGTLDAARQKVDKEVQTTLGFVLAAVVVVALILGGRWGSSRSHDSSQSSAPCVVFRTGVPGEVGLPSRGQPTEESNHGP